MTAPMIFGICMTFHSLLVHKLRPRSLRRGLGLTFLVLGVMAIVRVSVLKDIDFIVVLTLTFSGLDLLFGRDPFTEQAD